MTFRSDHAFTAPGLLQGHVLRPAQPGQIWHVGLFVQDRLISTVAADLPGEAAADDARFGHGFTLRLNTSAMDPQDRLRLEVLNTAHVILDTTLAALHAAPPPARARGASVRHLHGLTLTGLLEDSVTDLPSYEIVALEGERIVGRSRVWRWQHVGQAQDPLGRALGFELLLDPDLADGHWHQIHVETSTGQRLPGSPVQVLAWPHDLPDLLPAPSPGRTTPALRRRMEMRLQALLGNSMPLSAYASLYPELAAQDAPWQAGGDLGCDGRWYPVPGTDWVLCCHRSLTPLPRFAARVQAALPDLGPTAPRALFCDLALRQPDGSFWPLLFAAFDWERLLEQGHAALCFALPRAALQPGAASLVALLLDWLSPDGQSPARADLWHLPHPGALGEATVLEASAPARSAALAAALRAPGRLPGGTQLSEGQPGLFPAVHLHRPVQDRAISVIVPSRNQGALLETAITGLIAQNPGFDLDILIVDNGTDEADSLATLARLKSRGARILAYRDGFNFARINNFAVEHARHEQLCFMNNDVAFPQPGVLHELCSRLACPGVGAVGPLMLRASDIVQHGGVTLGPWMLAVHAFEDRMLGDPGYAEGLRTASEPGGVTGALMLTRRSLFTALGGFDPHRFAVNFNDVDYGLKLRAAGHRVVFTPHVWIRHYESVSRGRETATPAATRMQRELACLRAIWPETLRNDPQYHPLFALDALPYRALATRHRDPAPRRAALAPPLPLPGWA